MNLMFFAVALTMMLVALSFAATPLIMSYSRQNAGFAKMPLLAVIVVVGLAIALYAIIGRPGVSSRVSPASNAGTEIQPSQSDTQKDKAASVDSLLAGLEERLCADPDDGKGWLLLAQSYDHMGRASDAAEAYKRAAALDVTDEALQARLNSSSSTAVESAGEIRGRISLADSVADQVEPNDVIFITVKAGGDPMPLAVLRRSAAELPFDFVLSDENSMVKGSGIATASEVVVTAKISKSGDALNTATGLEAASQPFEPRNAKFLELVVGSATQDSNAK